MSSQKKNKRSFERNTTTHGTLLVIIAGYILYLAYCMIKNKMTGNTQMSTLTTGITSGLMILAGLGVLGYAAVVWYRVYKKTMYPSQSQQNIESDAEEDEQPNDGGPEV